MAWLLRQWTYFGFISILYLNKSRRLALNWVWDLDNNYTVKFNDFSTSNRNDNIELWNQEFSWVWGSLFGIFDIWWVVGIT